MKRLSFILTLTMMLFFTACTESLPEAVQTHENLLSIEEPKTEIKSDKIVETEIEEPETEKPETEEPEEYIYYPALNRIDKVYFGDGWTENDVVFALNDDECSELWKLMRIDEWVIATDLPPKSFSSEFYIVEEGTTKEEIIQVWFFCKYDGKLLIIPSFRNPGDDREEKTCYFAPIDIMTEIITFIETLIPVSEV